MSACSGSWSLAAGRGREEEGFGILPDQIRERLGSEKAFPRSNFLIWRPPIDIESLSNRGGYRKTNPIFEFNKKYHQCEQCDRMRFRVIRRRIKGIGWNRIEPMGKFFFRLLTKIRNRSTISSSEGECLRTVPMKVSYRLGPLS